VQEWNPPSDWKGLGVWFDIGRKSVLESKYDLTLRPEGKELVNSIERAKREPYAFFPISRDPVYLLVAIGNGKDSLTTALSIQITMKLALESGRDFNSQIKMEFQEFPVNKFIILVRIDLTGIRFGELKLIWANNPNEYSGVSFQRWGSKLEAIGIQTTIGMPSDEGKELPKNSVTLPFSEGKSINYIFNKVGLEAFVAISGFYNSGIGGIYHLTAALSQNIMGITKFLGYESLPSESKRTFDHALRLDLLAKTHIALDHLGSWCEVLNSGYKDLSARILDLKTDKIHSFFKTIDAKKIYKIWQYSNISATSENGSRLVEKVTKENTEALREAIYNLGLWRSKYRKFYNKFKHGFPMMLGAYPTEGKTVPEGFEAMILMLGKEENFVESPKDLLLLGTTPGNVCLSIVNLADKFVRDLLKRYLEKIWTSGENLPPEEYFGNQLTPDQLKQYQQLSQDARKNIVGLKLEFVLTQCEEDTALLAAPWIDAMKYLDLAKQTFHVAT